jgi:hypothetical protein
MANEGVPGVHLNPLGLFALPVDILHGGSHKAFWVPAYLLAKSLRPPFRGPLLLSAGSFLPTLWNSRLN